MATASVEATTPLERWIEARAEAEHAAQRALDWALERFRG